MHLDERLGVPNFVWTTQTQGGGAAPAGRGQKSEEAAARTYLASHAELYGLKGPDIRAAVLQSVHNTGRGSIIVKFRQLVGGIEVFREEVKVVMNQKLELVAISGHLASTASIQTANRTFGLAPPQAIARAMGDLLDTVVDPLQLQKVATQAPYDLYQFASEAAARAAGVRMIEPARAKAVYFRLPDRLESAWYVEFQVSRLRTGDDALYGYVIGAADGKLLFRHNQIAYDSYNYRVWADRIFLKAPFDSPHGNSLTPQVPPEPGGPMPPYVGQNAVSLESGPISTGDPWLPRGAIVTAGNNVQAYADLAAPDGYVGSTGDLYGWITSANTFDHIYNPNLSAGVSRSQIQASVVQLFYDVNFFHDWFYDSGFKEADGNAQMSNYGRGGLAGDSMKAEAQDFGGRNNANMFTPADGARPRMQMYVFDGPGTDSLVATGAVSGTFETGVAAFGPKSSNVTGPMSLTTPRDGCAAITTPLAGKIAFIDRGSCGFSAKVKNAQLAGALGAIIANVATSPDPAVPPGMGGDDPTITILSLTLNLADGNLFRAALGAGSAVTGTMRRTTDVDRDGTLDNQIVAHEWGHFISNRLIGDASGLNTQMANGLGEGWADFHALLMTVKSVDSLFPH